MKENGKTDQYKKFIFSIDRRKKKKTCQY